MGDDNWFIWLRRPCNRCRYQNPHPTAQRALDTICTLEPNEKLLRKTRAPRRALTWPASFGQRPRAQLAIDDADDNADISPPLAIQNVEAAPTIVDLDDVDSDHDVAIADPYWTDDPLNDVN